ncbi:hypothetical protein Syun_021118 [Stephania yunnanensis]|uniref:Uncharacterized protein n=1 Tax=Stephania yunnanensis TaxID=152371 RepID=A0AAP0IF54_9MAGN
MKTLPLVLSLTMRYWRRTLEGALRWMDSPTELCILQSTKKMATDVINFLSGKSLGPTTITTATPTAATTTTDTTVSTLAALKHS